MARLRSDFPPAKAIRDLADNEGLLRLKVTPGSSRDQITLPEVGGDPVVQVRITTPPVDGKANTAVLKLLAKALGVPRTSLELVRGETSREKTIRLP